MLPLTIDLWEELPMEKELRRCVGFHFCALFLQGLRAEAAAQQRKVNPMERREKGGYFLC